MKYNTNKQLQNIQTYSGIICKRKKQIKTLVSKKEYKDLKNHIYFLFDRFKKVVVYDNVNSFQGGGVNITLLTAFYGNTVKYKEEK